MIRYTHTQRSPLLPPLAAAILAVIILAAVLSDGGLFAVGIVFVAGSLIALLVLVFSRLTVDVADSHIRVAFGAGWPARKLSFDAIESARAVRNSWWHGWGIRWIPGGVIWNVWGLDAVELLRRGGRRCRVGTDEPAALLAALSGLVQVS